MSSAKSLGLIDSHAHIQGKEFVQDLSAVIERAQEAGLEKIIVVGGAGDLSSNQAAVELAGSSSMLYATVGMHPHDAKEVQEKDLLFLEELMRRPRVVAVGETGLDFYYDHSPRELQAKMFGRFIQMALAARLPLVVHNRQADREAAELLRREGKGEIRGVVHCFTSDYAAAREFLDLGLYISFSGIVTFKNAESLREVVRRLPLDRILVETDSPYLAPVPHRGKRNEPAFVRFVAETVAQVKGIALEEVTEATSRNAQELFAI